MVPLRIDVCDDRSRASVGQPRPQLFLKDLTAERPSHSRVRRSPFHSLESIFLAAAAAAVLLFFFFNFAFSLVHSVQQRYTTPYQPAVVMISHVVAHGETLTSLAKHYGDPSIYILKREEQIALANHLSGTSPLVPGQHLRLPVTSPSVITQIEQRYQHGLVASR